MITEPISIETQKALDEIHSKQTNMVVKVDKQDHGDLIVVNSISIMLIIFIVVITILLFWKK